MQINITVKYRLMPVQKNPKILIEKGMHTSMFIATLFTIAKIWKQSKCLSIDEWIKKMW